MVKNTTGGSKHKKQKNHSTKKERELTIKEDENEFYGQITTFLGGNMVKVRKIGSLMEYRCKLRKALPRIHKNDVVLYAIRDFGSNEIGDVLLVYTPEELMILKREKYIEEDIKINDVDAAIIFDNEEEVNENKEKDDDDDEKEVNLDEL
jgi:translation initiation factor 1A